MGPVPQGKSPGAAQQCVFCQIISGAVPSRKVYEDDLVLAVLDIRPAAPGHVLIMPKQHAMMMPQLPPEVIARLGMTVKVLSKVLLQTFQCKGITLFIANGAAAGQRIPHFMMHLIPRHKDDGLPLQLEEQEVTEDFLKKLRAKLMGETLEEEADGEDAVGAAEGTGENPPEDKQQETEESNEDEEIDPDDVESLFR